MATERDLGRITEMPTRATGWSAGVTCLILAVLFYRLTLTVADPDLWGHVRFGLDICQSGRIIQDDPYSYLTAGQPWINHEWLAEVLFALAFRLAGPPGLIVLKVAVGLVILGILYRFLCRRGLDALRAGIVMLLVTLLLLPGVATVRPHLFTYLLLLLVLRAIESAERGRPRGLWFLPLIFACWVNLHGGFLAGLAILLTWAGIHLCLRLFRRPDDSGPSTALLVLIPAASLLATLVNPYGWRLLVFLLRTATVPRPEIAEWGPLRLMSLEGGVYLALLTVAALALLGSGRRRSPALLAVLACVSLAPLLAIRHVPLYAAAWVILVGEHLADAWHRWLPDQESALTLTRLRPWLTGLSFLAAIGLVGAAVPRFRCVRLDRATGFEFPVRAVDVMRRAGVNGNFAVHFDWGEYVLWQLGPRVRVSVDGRRETVFPDDVYLENVRFGHGVGDWDALLRRPETDGALVSKKFAVFNLLRLEPGWRLVYEDAVCGLFVREGSPLQKQIHATQPEDLPADGAGTCFP